MYMYIGLFLLDQCSPFVDQVLLVVHACAPYLETSAKSENEATEGDQSGHFVMASLPVFSAELLSYYVYHICFISYSVESSVSTLPFCLPVCLSVCQSPCLSGSVSPSICLSVLLSLLDLSLPFIFLFLLTTEQV